ncbi:MAG: ABC transporter substrate-binding protein [Gammaproteobacteria bacterium]
MSWIQRGALLAAACSIAAASASAAGRLVHQHAVTAPVAALLDLRGAQASLGRPAMNGFVLGLQQGDQQGDFLFSALIDTQSDPQVTAAAARAAAAKAALAAGFTDNDSVLIAGPFFQRARVPFLSIGATDPALPRDVGDRIFLTPFGDNTQAAAGAEFGHGEFGASVAILWDSTSEYTRNLPRYFRTRFEELGGEVMVDASYDGGCDITSLGEQVAALAADFVYLAGLPDCIGAVVGSLRSAGVTMPIIGGDGLDTPELLEQNPGPSTDIWFTTHAWLAEQGGTPAARAFVAAYRDAYGTQPADAFAALGYDAARLILDALHRAQTDNQQAILDALENTRDFEGVTGTISFSPESHVPLKTVWVIAVHNGEKSLARSFIPSAVPPPLDP